MTHPDGAQRILEGGDAPDVLRDLLRQSQADVPSAAELAHLENALGPVLGPPPGVTGPGSRLTTGQLAGAAGAVVAGALVVAALLLQRGGSPGEAPGAGGGAAASVATTPVSAPEASAARQPAPGGLPASQEAAPERAPSAAAERAVTPNLARPAPSEAQLLEQARALLRTDPRRSLALAREHQRRFPRGALAQEREVIAIEALSRMNREDEARQRAKGFDQRYPESPHKPKVDSAAREP